MLQALLTLIERSRIESYLSIAQQYAGIFASGGRSPPMPSGRT